MISAPPPSRNSPCPCGSGKRYKDCCGALGTVPAANAPGRTRDPQALLAQATGRHQAGRLDEARALYEEVLAVDPRNAFATHYLGVLAMQRGDLDTALERLEASAAMRPDLPAFHANLGLCRRRRGEIRAAIDCQARACELDPRSAEAHSNLAVALQEHGRIAEALAEFGRSLELDPAHAEAHYNRGLALLSIGDYARGWEEFEWRARCREFASRNLVVPGLPPWRGEPLAGRTLYVRVEQGHGDTLQFARFLPALADRGARVVLEAASVLAEILRSVDPRVTLVEPGTFPAGIDCYVNLMSVPRWLGVGLDAIPNPPPYLAVDEAKVRRWRERLAGAAGRTVGIVWGGNPAHHNDRNRSCALAALSGLLDLEGHRWFSLQVGPRARELAQLAHPRLVDLGPELATYAETAAAVSALDLVVSVDTSVVHLAGALGRPAWVMLPKAPDWRWLLDREDSPWYPSLRLFRQKAAGDWRGVIDDVRNALLAPAGA
ncbi:MAG: tetratricopeptide repeat protein [Betaproteobacteria bacterium]|nr:tetratricopeptide repeat protein [Betaproteobacteria bacterium]